MSADPPTDTGTGDSSRTDTDRSPDVDGWPEHGGGHAGSDDARNETLGEPTLDRRTMRLATGALAAVAAVAAWLLATEVFPYHSLNHDEAVYLQQAALLLDGQLAIHPPVEGALRPWFFVDGGDRLYPKYAPVPAAVFALGRLAGGYRLALAAVAAGNVALVAGVGSAVFDRRTGLVAAAVLLCSPLFLLQSAVFLPYAPTTLLNLAFAYAYLRADATGSRRWAAVAGAAVGLAFFSRPYTAVLFAAPFVAHALWTLRGVDPRTALRGADPRPVPQDADAEADADADRNGLPGPVARQATTAALGLGGVALALAYNAATTGSPFLFPYEAFAPRDGLGFGHRAILGHEVDYTVELALRANRTVVSLFVREWIAGGLLGAALAVAGFAATAYRGLDAREAALAGVAGTVVAGNVYFWGNYNLLGDVDRAGDGLVAVLGPYYHFDLLVPTAVFAAAGALAAFDRARRLARGRLDARAARAVLAALVLATAGALGTVTAADLDRRVEENMEATRTYERAYEPFAGGPPANSVVLLPTPYGPWLNHPFQALRNDPGFDGRAVYALDTRPFAVADAFPDRRLYRYGYRGAWAPFAGSPEAARLRRVRDVAGERVRLTATVGVPESAVGVTARVATDGGSVYAVARNRSSSFDLALTLAPDRVRVRGVPGADGESLAIDGRATVLVTVFVDYGPRGGFTYRLSLPVEATDSRVRALSPDVDRCRGARTCGEGTAHVPATAPEGVFVRTSLQASNAPPNSTETESRLNTMERTRRGATV